MATWYSTATPEEVDRIDRAWKDAPTMNLELAELIFETAREQVLAYAPAPGAEEGEVIPGPVTLARRNLFRNPRAMSLDFLASSGASTPLSLVADFPGSISTAVRSTRAGSTAAVRALDIRTGSDTPAAGVPVTIRFTARASTPTPVNVISRTQAGTQAGQVTFGVVTIDTQPQEFVLSGLSAGGTNTSAGFNLTSSTGALGDWIEFTGILIEQGSTSASYFDGSTAPVTVGDRVLSHAWEGAENASMSVETYRPNVFVPAVPRRYVYAQLQQARNLWLAGRTDQNGDIGGEYSFTPRPLDKTIRDIIRPVDGKPHVL